jgi:hypothetical protein
MNDMSGYGWEIQLDEDELQAAVTALRRAREQSSPDVTTVKFIFDAVNTHRAMNSGEQR